MSWKLTRIVIAPLVWIGKTMLCCVFLFMCARTLIERMRLPWFSPAP